MTTINPAPLRLQVEAQIRSTGILRIERMADKYCQFYIGEGQDPICTLDWEALEQLRQFLNKILDADRRTL
jgi:hypothetical protein